MFRNSIRLTVAFVVDNNNSKNDNNGVNSGLLSNYFFNSRIGQELTKRTNQDLDEILISMNKDNKNTDNDNTTGCINNFNSDNINGKNTPNSNCSSVSSSTKRKILPSSYLSRQQQQQSQSSRLSNISSSKNFSKLNIIRDNKNINSDDNKTIKVNFLTRYLLRKRYIDKLQANVDCVVLNEFPPSFSTSLTLLKKYSIPITFSPRRLFVHSMNFFTALITLPVLFILLFTDYLSPSKILLVKATGILTEEKYEAMWAQVNPLPFSGLFSFIFSSLSTMVKYFFKLNSEEDDVDCLFGENNGDLNKSFFKGKGNKISERINYNDNSSNNNSTFFDGKNKGRGNFFTSYIWVVLGQMFLFLIYYDFSVYIRYPFFKYILAPLFHKIGLGRKGNINNVFIKNGIDNDKKNNFAKIDNLLKKASPPVKDAKAKKTSFSSLK